MRAKKWILDASRSFDPCSEFSKTITGSNFLRRPRIQERAFGFGDRHDAIGPKKSADVLGANGAFVRGYLSTASARRRVPKMLIVRSNSHKSKSRAAEHSNAEGTEQ
jgi:hypothetical protein